MSITGGNLNRNRNGQYCYYDNGSTLCITSLHCLNKQGANVARKPENCQNRVIQNESKDWMDQPGTVSFSIMNSTHDETAAKVYSTLWLRRNESNDKL